MIHPCPNGLCRSAFQDDLYGRGRRVHNDCKSGTPGVAKIRCTVCKNEQTIGRAEVSKEALKDDPKAK